MAWLRPAGASFNASTVSGAFSQNLLDVPLSVHDGDDLQRGRVRPVHDGVVGKGGDRPEAHWQGSDIVPRPSHQRMLGQSVARGDDLQFHFVGRYLLSFAM